MNISIPAKKKKRIKRAFDKNSTLMYDKNFPQTRNRRNFSTQPRTIQMDN